MTSNNAKRSAQTLIGLSSQQLKTVLGAPVKSPMPVILYNYLYVRGTTTFDEMTYLSASDRMTLKEGFSLNFPTIASSVESFRNGPRRLSLVYPDLVSPINATLIPRVDHFVPDLAAANRKKYKKPSESSDKSGLTEASESPMGTLCLSTHAHDPISGRLVPLSAAQLIAQVVVGLKEAGDLPRPSKKERVPRKITQFAFTGPGDPLLNFKAVSEAIKFMNNKAGLDIAAWRHVIQTDGVPDLMGVAARKLRARIVLNVHSANDHLRSQLVPQNRVFPIRDVINALRRYIGYTEKTASKHKEVTFDYALLDGINDTYQDMQDLIELIEGLPAHVNLIPVNLWPEKGFHASPIDKVMGYLGEFKRLGISCSIRTPPRFPRL